MAKKNFDKTEENLANIEEAVSRTEKFVENNKKNLSYGVLALFAIVILFMGYTKYISKPNDDEAYNSIWQAEQFFAQDQFDKALNGDGADALGFLDIIDEYGSTPSGNLANYYAGICYLNLAKNDTTGVAEDYFELAIDFLSDFSSDDVNIKPMSIGAIGDCKMELGDTEAAAKKYLEAANYMDNVLLSPMFLKKAAMTYSLLNDHQKSLELFERIEADYPTFESQTSVRKYISREKQYLGQ